MTYTFILTIAAACWSVPESYVLDYNLSAADCANLMLEWSPTLGPTAAVECVAN